MDLLKIAARAWKAHIGELAEAGIDRLRESNILNHQKELAGLKRGTHNLVKSLGIQETNLNKEDLIKHIKKSVSEEPGLRAMAKGYGVSVDRFVDSTMPVDGIEQSKGHMGLLYGKKPTLNRGWGMPDVLKPKSDLTFHKDYTEALIHRHEANEIRYGLVAQSKPKKSVDIGGTRFPATSFVGTSHGSPKVIMRESADAAIAPKAVKDTFVEARTQDGPEGFHLGQQAQYMYGSSGVYNKSVADKLEKGYVKKVKPNLLQTKEYLHL